MDQTQIYELEERRKKALESRNAMIYFKLCNELGVEPEAEDLFELGTAEHDLDSERLTEQGFKNLLRMIDAHRHLEIF